MSNFKYLHYNFIQTCTKINAYYKFFFPFLRRWRILKINYSLDLTVT